MHIREQIVEIVEENEAMRNSLLVWKVVAGASLLLAALNAGALLYLKLG